ncbi:MAG: PKD domain-containing protein [Flavobacteriales bacterium]|nr:PKD domain-containing protein [Flavobacteriales bacterium]
MKDRSLIFSLALSINGAVHAQPTFEPTDLRYAIHLCSDTVFTPAVDQSFTGDIADLNPANHGCLLTDEHQSVFVRFSVVSSGRIGFTVMPAQPMDFDFAVWGPFAESVDTLTGAPVRCSYAAQTGNTGLSFQASDLTEGSSGDSWVARLNVVEGQHYVLCVDNFALTGLGFALEWQLEDGAALSCPGLPQAAFEPSTFTAGVGESIAFADLSTNDPYAWYWEFPGASVAESTDQFPEGISYTTPGCYDVRLTAYNAAGSGLTVQSCSITVDGSTSMHSSDETVVLMFDGRTLRFVPKSNEVFQVTLLDALGRMLEQQQEQGSFELSMAARAPGSYTVLIRTGSGWMTRRVALSW